MEQRFLDSLAESSSQGGKTSEFALSRFPYRPRRRIALLRDHHHHRSARCPYDTAILASHLQPIQKIIDQFNLEAYDNLNAWVSEIDGKIGAVFFVQLRSVLDLWYSGFSKDGEVVRFQVARRMYRSRR